MSDARTKAMAQIEAHLEEDVEGLQSEPVEEEADLDAAASTMSAKEQVKENLRADEEEVKKEEDEEDEEIDPLNSTRRRMLDTQKQLARTAGKVSSTAGSLWGTLGRVSTPGSIFLPVAILLLFFFLLLPVNGNTRAGWLWLAITGNAQIGGNGEGGGGEEVVVPDASIVPLRTFTGVE